MPLTLLLTESLVATAATFPSGDGRDGIGMQAAWCGCCRRCRPERATADLGP
mgnify:CR=1 FL=1